MERIDPSSDTKLTVKEDNGGTYVDMDSTYANVVAYLYDAGGTEIEKWSRETLTGYKSIYVIDAYTYEFYFYRASLASYKRKKVKLEIKYVESVASRGLSDNEEHTLCSVWFAIEDSNTGDQP